MSSKLSSLLVQAGAVTVKQIEDAFQRQVIYGGDLDTVLLEIGAVDEVTLCRHMHVAADMPPADLSGVSLEEFVPAAGELKAETADGYGVVPVKRMGGRLHVLAKSSVTREHLEELSYLLGAGVVPYVVPEVRLAQVAHVVYGKDLDSRMAALVDRLGPPPALRDAGIPAVALGGDDLFEVEAMLPGEGGQESPAVAIGGDAQPVTAESVVEEQPPVAEVEPDDADRIVQDEYQRRGTIKGMSADHGMLSDGMVASAAEVDAAVGSVAPLDAQSAYQRTETLQGVVPTTMSQPEERSPGSESYERRGTIKGMASDHGPPEESRHPGDTIRMPAAVMRSAMADWPASEAHEPGQESDAGQTGQSQGMNLQDRDLGQDTIVSDPESLDMASGGFPSSSGPGDTGAVVAGTSGAESASGVLAGEIQADTGLRAASSMSSSAASVGGGEPKVVADTASFHEMARAAKGEIDVEHVPQMGAVESSGPSVLVHLEVPQGPVESPGSDDDRLEPGQAAELLGGVVDRDEILDFLARGAASRCEFVAVFVVYGEHAVGRVAVHDGRVDRRAIAQVQIPLTVASLFRTVIETGTQYYGPVQDEGLNFSVLTRLDRLDAGTVVVLPVQLKNRVVCVLYGDNGSEGMDPSVVADLALLPAAAGNAFQRLILESKRRRYSEASEGAAVRVSSEHAQETTAKTGQQNATGYAAAGNRDDARVVRAEEPVSSSEVTRPIAVHAEEAPRALSEAAIELMLDQLEAGGELGERAERVLSEGGEAVVNACMARFPGRLWVDRHVPCEIWPPVREHGPLLKLLVDMMPITAPRVMTSLSAQDADVRFYATYFFSGVRWQEAVPILYQRMFDGDAGIRRAAMTAVAFCAVGPMRQTVLEYLHGVLQQGVEFHMACAADAVGFLDDRVAVPMLIDMVDHGNVEVGEAAQRALLLITKHAFGRDKDGWWAWWRQHSNEHPVEWMLDALDEQDLECRFVAVRKLTALADQDFGYRFDLDDAERAEAVARWRSWWEQQANAQQ
ncbi:MAG: hypothetical protein J7M25_03995 [Deltaproteobacteria bacterium]|nr:hypothetical protein [Deltaproteobacteria bacterium]